MSAPNKKLDGDLVAIERYCRSGPVFGEEHSSSAARPGCGPGNNGRWFNLGLDWAGVKKKSARGGFFLTFEAGRMRTSCENASDLKKKRGTWRKPDRKIAYPVVGETATLQTR